jgi:hypothetical protein
MNCWDWADERLTEDALAKSSYVLSLTVGEGIREPRFKAINFVGRNEHERFPNDPDVVELHWSPLPTAAWFDVARSQFPETANSSSAPMSRVAFVGQAHARNEKRVATSYTERYSPSD